MRNLFLVFLLSTSINASAQVKKVSEHEDVTKQIKVSGKIVDSLLDRKVETERRLKKLERKKSPSEKEALLNPCGEVCEQIANRCKVRSIRKMRCHAVYQSNCYQRLRAEEVATVNNCWMVKRDIRAKELRADLVDIKSDLDSEEKTLKRLMASSSDCKKCQIEAEQTIKLVVESREKDKKKGRKVLTVPYQNKRL